MSVALAVRRYWSALHVDQGEWQSYQIWFRAPRFDARARRSNWLASYASLYNGQLVQKDVEVVVPRARGALNRKPPNPLMLQGDHGPVAFRNIHVRPLRALVVR
jgi:hypothetical protein